MTHTRKREAYFIEYADKARAICQATLVVTGGFRSGAGMANALQSGSTDMIGLARPLAVYPDLPNRILEDSHYKIAIKRPSTGIKAIDFMAMLDITWYELQLRRLASGQRTKVNLGAWEATVNTLLSTGYHAFQQRRA